MLLGLITSDDLYTAINELERRHQKDLEDLQREFNDSIGEVRRIRTTQPNFAIQLQDKTLTSEELVQEIMLRITPQLLTPLLRELVKDEFSNIDLDDIARLIADRLTDGYEQEEFTDQVAKIVAQEIDKQEVVEEVVRQYLEEYVDHDTLSEQVVEGIAERLEVKMIPSRQQE